MYQISEKEFNYLQGIIANQIACYNANIPHHADELWSIGVYAIGKACNLYKEGNVTKFTTYATTAIINEFRYWYRGEKKRLADAHIDAVINEDKNLCTYHEMLEDPMSYYEVELRIDIDNALNVLSEVERQVVELYMLGYTHKTIASMLNYSATSSVTRILKRSYEKLRKELQYV